MSFAFTIALLMHQRRRYLRHISKRTTALSHAFETFELILLGILALVVGYARIHLGYHSIDQVGAGFCLGAVVAIVWYSLFMRFFHELNLHAKTDSRMSRALNVINSWHDCCEGNDGRKVR